MAYENVTYEVILQRMIDRVKVKHPNLDIREGSIIFNALAPAALELAIMYTELDNILSQSFVDTATRGYLLTACEQMGMDISVFDASYGTHKCVFNVEVPIGSRWNCELYNYYISEYIGVDDDGNHEYKAICETVGVEPNAVTGDLIAITYTSSDLTIAKVTECLIEGEDETSDEKIREAYYDHVNNNTVDGNVRQYNHWCNTYPGVGNYKVTPLWNGVNTVKVSILSASNGVASEELISDFQEYLDPNSEGMGNGVAPIGAIVTVTTATEFPVDIYANITMKPNYTDTSVIDTAVKDYFSKIAYDKDVVSYMAVGAAILNAEGVESVTNLQLNDETYDLVLGGEEIPVLGQHTWVVT